MQTLFSKLGRLLEKHGGKGYSDPVPSLHGKSARFEIGQESCPMRR